MEVEILLVWYVICLYQCMYCRRDRCWITLDDLWSVVKNRILFPSHKNFLLKLCTNFEKYCVLFWWVYLRMCSFSRTIFCKSIIFRRTRVIWDVEQNEGSPVKTSSSKSVSERYIKTFCKGQMNILRNRIRRLLEQILSESFANIKIISHLHQILLGLRELHLSPLKFLWVCE